MCVFLCPRYYQFIQNTAKSVLYKYIAYICFLSDAQMGEHKEEKNVFFTRHLSAFGQRAKSRVLTAVTTFESKSNQTERRQEEANTQEER